MKDDTRQMLLALDMDMDKTLARFVGNEALLFRFLRKFLADQSYAQLKQALSDGDIEAGFRASHTLKGVAGNLGLDGLFHAVSPLVEVLRSNDASGADAMFRAVEQKYDEVIATIQAIGDAP